MNSLDSCAQECLSLWKPKCQNASARRNILVGSKISKNLTYTEKWWQKTLLWSERARMCMCLSSHCHGDGETACWPKA